MNAQAIIHDARADGVVLSLAQSGRLKVAGAHKAVSRWAPTLREHKEELLTLLLNGSIAGEAPDGEITSRYYAHHFRCAQCIAAGRNPQLSRCREGGPLWKAHDQVTKTTRSGHTLH